MQKINQKELLKSVSGYQIQIITDTDKKVIEAGELIKNYLMQLEKNQLSLSCMGSYSHSVKLK